MHQEYGYVWNSAEFGAIPCNVQREEGEKLVIRAPDPYDKGEVQFSVPSDEVARKRPASAGTHTFVHSSSFGSYTTECTIKDVLPDGTCVIQYFDSYVEEPISRAVHPTELTKIV